MTTSNRFVRALSMTALLAVMSVSIAGCATNPNNAYDDGVYDPLEGLNRATLALNEGLDAIIFNPLTSVYRAIVPEIGRKAVTNVLSNLKSPVYLANELLQGDLEDAGTVVRRFVTNTIAGVGGIVDVAAMQGIEYQAEDFGQTLATWGIGNGPYIVWPILGPSTLRDSVGFVGDIAMDPLYWYAQNTDRDEISYIRTGLTVLDAKNNTRDILDDLRRNSGDYYKALQSVYIQRRNAVIRDSDPSFSALPTIE